MNKYSLPVLIILLLQISMAISADKPKEILLWLNGAPGSEGKTEKEQIRITDKGEHILSNIHRPSITPYIPAKEKSTGAAVIICPGGGHRELWIEHEGYMPAQWLSEQGIAAFVLKYRLARYSNSTYTIDIHELMDIHRAIKYVKYHAKEWNIDTSRVGVMGFSAGGEVAALSAMRFDYGNNTATDPIELQSSRPAFQALIYPAYANTYVIIENIPPVFLAAGYHDHLGISEELALLYVKYKKAGVPAELHLYAQAGHGFGMRESNHTASAGWPMRFMEWLKDLEFLK